MTDMNELGKRVDDLQAAYLAALDGKNMRAWLDLFATDEDSSYTCTAAENVDAGLPVALMLDDSRARLMDRVTFIEKVWAGTFQDYRTRHFVQRLHMDCKNEQACSVVTNFHVMFTPEESGDSRPLACGIYEDEIVIRDGVARFLHKRAITDTIVLPRYVVYPL